MNKKLSYAIQQMEKTNTELENISEKEDEMEDLETKINSLFKHSEVIYQNMLNVKNEIEVSKKNKRIIDPKSVNIDEGDNPWDN